MLWTFWTACRSMSSKGQINVLQGADQCPPRGTSIHYAMQEFSVGSAVRRFRLRLERDKTCRKLTARAIATLHNE
jgi:hypothetical protein